MKISELSVRRPTLVVVVFTILAFLGLMSFKTLKYELFPKFSSPIFTIVTIYPGAGPSEVENSVSKRIEEAVSGLSNVDVVRSISQEGVSMVIVTLKYGADIDLAVNEASRKVEAIRSLLPLQVRDPSVTKIAIGEFPVITLGVNAEMAAERFNDELNYYIKPAFAKINGVGEVSLIGGVQREIQVNIDHSKLDNYHISIVQVLQAIQASNIEFPAGKISNKSGQTLLRVSAKFSSISDITNLVVTQLSDGSLIKLKDIAEVIDAQKEPSSLFRVNGIPSVGIQIKKQDDANAVVVCDAVKKEIPLIEKQYSNENMKFSIVNDNSMMIMHSVNAVVKDLTLAIILVTIIMFLFLHSVRNAIIVMITVPLSIISSLLGIKLAGYTLNLITLVAISLVIGTLVDDAIVVLENIYRHLEMGKNRLQATIDGVREIGLSVISITLVLVVVFLPVALSKSMITPIIAPFAMVVVISVVISLIVAFTVVPLLTSRFSKIELFEHKSIWGIVVSRFEKGIELFSGVIQKMLSWSLIHRWITVGVSALLFVGSIALLAGGFIGSEFGNFGDMGECIVTIEYPKNYTLQQNNIASRKIEETISRMPSVVKIYSSVGSASGMLASKEAPNKTEINIKLVDKSKRKMSSAFFAKTLERQLNSQFTDVKVRTAVVLPTGTTDEAPVQIVFRAANTDTLFAFAERMCKEIARIPGTSNVKMSIEGENPEIAVKINKEKLARLGLSPEIVGATIQASFSGNTDNKYQSSNYEYDINVRLDAFDRKSISDVEKLTFVNNAGKTVKFKQFAEINEQAGPARYERYGRISSVIIESQALGRASGDIGNDIFKLLDKTKFPAGVSYLPESDLKFQGDAFGSLGAALLIAIVLVYLIMVALYESFLHPFVVLFSIPLAIIGALLAIALTGGTLSLFSMLGMIMLVGLVLKNAILVIDFANTLRKQGYEVKAAISSAVKLRIRPILMTAGATIIGMLPLALSHDAGSEWINGLGWVLIGGMTSSMLLSLIVVPVVYLIAENAKSKVTGWYKLAIKMGR